MCRQGQAILHHLREDHNVNVDRVNNTAAALTEIESDASVATVLVEWGDENSVIHTRKIIARMKDIGLEAPGIH